MKITDLKLDKNLMSMLGELFTMNGAKEIFKKYNFEMLTRETEVQGLQTFVSKLMDLASNSEAGKEYKEVNAYLEMELQSKTTMLGKATGIMKQFLEMDIESAKNKIKMVDTTNSKKVLDEINKNLDLILNDDDRKEVEGILSKFTLTDVKASTVAISQLKENIIKRYSEEKEETKQVQQEIPVETKEETVEKPVEKQNVKDIDDIDIDELNDLMSQDEVVEEPKKEEVKEEPKPKAKSRAKKVVEKPKEENYDLDDLDDLDVPPYSEEDDLFDETPKSEGTTKEVDSDFGDLDGDFDEEDLFSGTPAGKTEEIDDLELDDDDFFE